jgi:hypothetical protein
MMTMNKIFITFLVAAFMLPIISKAEDRIVFESFHNMRIAIGKSNDTFIVEGIDHNFANAELSRFIEYAVKKYNDQLGNPPNFFTIIIKEHERNLTDIEAETFNKINELVRSNAEFSNVQVIYQNNEHYPMIEYYWGEYNKNN